MNRAIKAIQHRIEIINEAMKVAEKTMDEPEMLSDYEFALNDLANYELELMELQEAITLLIKPLPTLNFIELENERFEWSKKTFPEATSLSSLAKAKDEIQEIEKDIKSGNKNPYEYVDAIMCIMDAAAREGMNSKEVMIAYKLKIEINKKRTWKKNPNNSYSHVKNYDI